MLVTIVSENGREFYSFLNPALTLSSNISKRGYSFVHGKIMR